jgi:aspartyl-tRNA(Asn)/glutamyl-tRNA(Gln) amidotransferase subunit A
MSQLSSAWMLSITEAGARLSDDTFSSVALTAMMLDRIAEIDPKLQSYVTVLENDALKVAAAADMEIATGRHRGPLHGIPIAIKDIFDTKGVKTTACSRLRENYVPDQDCTVVRKFREAGAVILGKVTTHEFAFGFDSRPTKNAWNLDHIPSGSSGGSGAAIAAGLCFAATGSDTGGSIRAPAAANGVAGIKPTYGRVSKAGVAVLSWSLDHVGPLARTVRDLAILLNIMSGQDPLDPHTKDVPVPDYAASLTGDIRGLRLGVPTNYFTDDVEPVVADAIAKALKKLESLGAKVVPVNIAELDGVLDCMLGITMSEASTYHQASLRSNPDLFEDETRLLLETGEMILATTYINAQRARVAVKAAFREALRDVDVILTPTQPTTALKIGQSMARIGAREESVFAVSARFCAPLNLSGLPAASVPCGFSPEKMPIGLQIIGRPFDEATVLKVADAFEQNTEWHMRYPPIAGGSDAPHGATTETGGQRRQ